MNEPKIVASPGRQERVTRAEPSDAWAALGWIGLVFLVVGGSDFALTWIPTSFGNREWEFATVTASFNGMPILVLGIGLLLVASKQMERRWWGFLAGAAALVMLFWMLVGGALWARSVPLAINSVPQEVVVGMNKALAKTAIQTLVYPIVLVYLGWRALKAARGGAGFSGNGLGRHSCSDGE